MKYGREVSVGAFVFLGLCAMGIVIFLIGDQRGLFEAKHQYSVVFNDVQGLKPGSSVRMGGVDVGTVTAVSLATDAKDPRLYVVLDIGQDASQRIRKDSVAKIDSKGLLGDKMVTVSVGSANQPGIPPGGVIKADEAGGMDAMVNQVVRIGEKAEKIMGNLESSTSALADETFRKDVQSSVKSLSGVLKSVDDRQGYVGRLISDPDEAARLSRTISSLERTAARLETTLDGVNSVLARVKDGPGFAHDIVYGDQPTKTLTQFGNAADEVALTLRGIREGQGPAKAILFGDPSSKEMMGNLTAMSADLRDMVAGMKAGKGTLGALLVDPSIYEDIKVLLGNVDRNRSLRALVRYSIQRDETQPKVEVSDPEKPPAAGAPAQKSPAH